METNRLISFAETARMLGRRSTRTVRRRIAAGDLPMPVYENQTPMLFASDVAAYIERLKEKRKAYEHE